MNKRWFAVLLCILMLLLCGCEQRQPAMTGPKVSKEGIEEFYARKAAAATAVSEENVLMSDKGEKVLGSDLLRSEVSAVTFLNTLESKGAESWDVSQGQNGSVWAWTVPNGNRFDLYIAAAWGIFAPEDMGGFFENYSNLTAVDFGSVLDTGNTVNMDSMFRGCENLRDLDLSSLNTAAVTDMGAMFEGTSALSALDLSSFDASSVTDMEAMFRGSGISRLELGDIDTGSVRSMASMFEGCGNLTRLDLSKLDTGSVTDMEAMFRDCAALEEVNLTGFSTGSVRSMAHMFERSGIRTLDVGMFDTSRVETMESMFGFCWELRELDLRSFDTARVETMASMFYDCSSLEYVDVTSFNTACVEDMRNMFYHDQQLQTPDVSGFDVSSVKYFDDFMLPGVKINGKPWQEMFTAKHTIYD